LPRNDDGEFELVLGNRQLISVFLIMVILLGVFFSMGYIVGRNSGPALTAEARTAAASKPIVVDRSADQSSASTAAPTELAPKPEEEKPAPSPKPTSTHPVTNEPPAKPAAAPPSVKEPVREAKSSESVARAVPTEPSPGEYWQVVATSRPDAEIVTEALVKKGFKAMLTQSPKEGIFRVLVGPSADAASLADTRTKLEAAGFKNPMMRKY
jgi:cell division septation protein DedD